MTKKINKSGNEFNAEYKHNMLYMMSACVYTMSEIRNGDLSWSSKKTSLALSNP